jgi:rhamnosyltransferase subunit B
VTQTTNRARLVLCQWPEWFASPQPDWPANAVTTGFLLSPAPDGQSNGNGGPAAVDPAAAPIVATTGSLAGAQFKFFRSVVDASLKLGRPAVLVTPHPDHIPPDLPPQVTHLRHAPFQQLFAGAALVVHHGGIGTTAYALAAGVPQIVMPLRGEQFDIGNRASRLSVARMMSSEHTTVDQLVRAMRGMLNSPRVARWCRHWQSRFAVGDGGREAVDQIEAAAAG